MSVNPCTSKQEPASPCIGICKLDPKTNFCEGCFRTLDEIASWGQCSRKEKQHILDQLENRCERLVDNRF